MPRCHFIDPVQQLEGELSSDGIHPTPAGYDILGKLVWDDSPIPDDAPVMMTTSSWIMIPVLLIASQRLVA